jgi:hypothetical protein
MRGVHRGKYSLEIVILYQLYFVLIRIETERKEPPYEIPSLQKWRQITKTLATASSGAAAF